MIPKIQRHIGHFEELAKILLPFYYQRKEYVELKIQNLRKSFSALDNLEGVGEIAKVIDMNPYAYCKIPESHKKHLLG